MSAAKSMRLSVLLVLGFLGCAHVDQPRTAASLAGEYTNGDPFWPRTLKLHQDGSFSYDQMTDIIKSENDGTMVFEGSWGMNGTWSFQPPDRIELLTTHKDRVAIFVRVDSRGRLALLEPDLYPEILKTWTPAPQRKFVSHFLTRWK